MGLAAVAVGLVVALLAQVAPLRLLRLAVLLLQAVLAVVLRARLLLPRQSRR